MKLSDLAAYAEKKYHIEEKHKWPDFPGFSVLCSPDTGKWLALLMRQWDSIHGDMIEICDIKCGQQILEDPHSTFLSKPYRMHGKKWVGIRMGAYVDTDIVRTLFDRAFEAERKQRFTIELEPRTPKEPPEKVQTAQPSRIPKKIFEMIHLYSFGDNTFEGRCRNFYRQGKFMEDFEDDAPNPAEFKHYYTTYHDLNITQLRAYFTWRTKVRKGKYEPVALSLAYMYLYELICGIGCRTPQEAFDKLEEFDHKYIGAGYGDGRMRTNLHQWLSDLTIVHGLDRPTAERFKYDKALCVLKDPETHRDEEIFSALSYLYSKKDWQTPVISKGGERGMHLFALVWSTACKDLFATIFGTPSETVYRPFSNAVCYSPQRHPDTVYTINPCRSYSCKDGRWTVRRYDPADFKQEKLDGFIHEADFIFRRHLKTGRYLRKKESEVWAEPYVMRALALEEASMKPEITINMQGLDKIRQDAAITRDSLLTEEELADVPEPAQPQAKQEPADNSTILKMLLRGEDITKYIKDNHLIPSVVTDEINGTFFDEIGDSVLSCDGNAISVVEDYRDDLISLLGEK